MSIGFRMGENSVSYYILLCRCSNRFIVNLRDIFANKISVGLVACSRNSGVLFGVWEIDEL